MDKLDMCLIPFIYLLRTTLIILSEFTLIVNITSIIAREFKNTLTWMEIYGIHLILITLSSIQSLIQVPLNVMLQLPLSRAILFYPKFYYSFFKYKEGRRSLWSIVTNPLGADYRRPVMQPNQIKYLNVSYHCNSFYQAKVAYDHLHLQINKDLE